MNFKFTKTLKVLGAFLIGAFSYAQTLTFDALPDNVEIGSTAQFELNYTSTVPCKIQVALYIFGLDGDGNPVPDWGGWQAGVFTEVLPPTDTESTQTLELLVPPALVPSSELNADQTYVWALSLVTESDEWITGGQYPVTLIPSGAVADMIDFSGEIPNIVYPESTYSIGYQYTAPEDRIIKIGLSTYNSSGWINDVATYILNPAIATTEDPVFGTGDITVPIDAILSADLPEGEFYRWEVGIFTIDWGFISSVQSDVIIEEDLGTKDFEKSKITVFPNPVKDVLFFEKSNEITSVQISDLNGKLVLNANTVVNGINVSNLPSGIYMVTVNGNQTVKFVKK